MHLKDMVDVCLEKLKAQMLIEKKALEPAATKKTRGKSVGAGVATSADDGDRLAECVEDDMNFVANTLSLQEWL